MDMEGHCTNGVYKATKGFCGKVRFMRFLCIPSSLKWGAELLWGQPNRNLNKIHCGCLTVSYKMCDAIYHKSVIASFKGWRNGISYNL